MHGPQTEALGTPAAGDCAIVTPTSFSVVNISPLARGGVGGRRSGSAAGAMGGARVVSGDDHARRRWPGRDAGMRGAARAVSTMWSGPEGRGVARDGDERRPRARPFEHLAQGPMGCVRVGSPARRGERAAAAGRRLGSSSAHGRASHRA